MYVSNTIAKHALCLFEPEYMFLVVLKYTLDLFSWTGLNLINTITSM